MGSAGVFTATRPNTVFDWSFGTNTGRPSWTIRSFQMRRWIVSTASCFAPKAAAPGPVHRTPTKHNIYATPSLETCPARWDATTVTRHLFISTSMACTGDFITPSSVLMRRWARSTFGGTQDDYDALNRRTNTMEVIDGDLRRYNQMLRIVNRALRREETTDEDYEQLQRYLAMDEFIDFMIVNQYVTNRDGISAFEGNNQRAIGSRVGDAQFRFFVWDMEYSLWNATDDNNVDRNRPALAGSNNPANGVWAIYRALRQHPEFRLR